MKKLTRGQMVALLDCVNRSEPLYSEGFPEQLSNAKRKLEDGIETASLSRRRERFLQPVSAIEVLK